MTMEAIKTFVLVDNVQLSEYADTAGSQPRVPRTTSTFLISPPSSASRLELKIECADGSQLDSRANCITIELESGHNIASSVYHFKPNTPFSIVDSFDSIREALVVPPTIMEAFENLAIENQRYCNLKIRLQLAHSASDSTNDSLMRPPMQPSIAPPDSHSQEETLELLGNGWTFVFKFRSLTELKSLGLVPGDAYTPMGPYHETNAQRGIGATTSAAGGSSIGGEMYASDWKNDDKHCKCGNIITSGTILCDNERCKTQYWHLWCVGLKEEPDVDLWLCPDCRDLEDEDIEILSGVSTRLCDC